MRTIKFRGKRIDNEEWVYGYYVCLQDTFRKPINKQERLAHRIYTGYADSCVSGGGYDFSEDFYYIDPETICQFTGLLDKNNKEIYEGDLLSTPLSDVNPFGMVAWHPNGYFFIDTEFGKRMPTEDHQTLGEMMNYMIGSRSTEFEVSGNIYDNPEPLEGGAK